MAYSVNSPSGRHYVGEPCTLNGKPATISGRQLPFAHVRTLHEPLDVEYAWHTVARIMAEGGNFRA